MNILILNWRDPSHPRAGGAEIVTLEHAKAWVKAGNQVVWFASSYANASPFERRDGLTIIRRGNSLSVFVAAFFFYIFSGYIFDVVVDEVHGIPFFTPLYVRKPKVAFIHEVAGEIWDYMFPFPVNIIGKLVEFFYLYIYRNISIWVDAPSTIDDLVKYGIVKNHCTAIPCPITNRVKGKIVPKGKQKTFIFLSRLVRMKGVEEVIKAFRLIFREDSDARFWIVGKGEEGYVQKLKKMVKKYGINANTIFWGAVNEKEKIKLLSRAHILLHASIKEGWGLVSLEAASQATPAVVYNVAGLRDSVKNNKTGIVVSKNTPTELAVQALHLLEDNQKYKRLQKNDLIWAKSLKWSSVTQQSLKLLRTAR